ncbi:ABC transporter [Bacillus sp. FJAT-27264]|uniref:YhgE/Pip domain-containing protein n=1 Tax=Paenibacillus sp. (strain DSM 101736 / FJAT-27264) TaxID=1850362 RepID=UPI000807AD71|nr:ABC transporter permease [Bacillus sp. FJAT-27264]OBZ18479.1 ABC transporter [Bacillus sp. FJAT-27264]
MLNALKAYLKKPATIVGIVMLLMFQVIFSIIWMTGYKGINENTSKLSIAIVNEDQGAGAKISEQLAASLPFHMVTGMSLEEAKGSLERREVQMVLQVPSDFSKQLQSQGQQAELRYTINESNPMMIKSVMQSVAAQITATVGKQVTIQGTEAVLKQANVPAAQAQGIAQGVVDKVNADMTFTNPVQGMNNQMVPMMMVLASFVGAMIMGMNFQQATDMIGPGISKWSKFGARVVINVSSAVVVSLIGSSLIAGLGGQHAGGFISVWLFQALFLLTFMFFAQMFLIVFGMAGMLFNMTLLSLQLVSSGAMVPRELLSGFYQGLGHYLPATYAVDGLMNLLFGGPSVVSDVLLLVAILAASLFVSLAATGLRKQTQRAVAPVAVPLK